MAPRFAALWLVAILIAAACALASTPSRSQAGTPPGILLTGEGIELFDPGSGGAREVVARRGGQPAFLPSGEAFAYIREGGCFPAGHDGWCYTEYSVFIKSLAEKDPTVVGRQLFGWTDFFVRAVDVSRGGRLVFSAKRGPGPDEHGNNLDIYSAALDGGDVRQLTDNPAFENDPAVSPDGRHIAFVRRVDGRGQIFTMGIDGSHLKRLTHDRKRNRLPSWSPDGRRLLFISQPTGANPFGRREIYAIGAHGGREHRLTHNKKMEGEATYSPDGRSIAFLLQRSLWLMGADGSAPHLIRRSPVIGGYEGGMDWG